MSDRFDLDEFADEDAEIWIDASEYVDANDDCPVPPAEPVSTVVPVASVVELTADEDKQIDDLVSRMSGCLALSKLDPANLAMVEKNLPVLRDQVTGSGKVKRAQEDEKIAKVIDLAAKRDLKAINAITAPVDDSAAMVPVPVCDIFAPLGPIPWVVEDLSLAAGAPGILGGYGGRGKSWFAQGLALCVATGEPFGTIRVKRGKVVYLDYEQGSRLTFQRFQQLALGLGKGPTDLTETLATHIMPTFRLNSDGAETKMAKLVEGAALCIIDSLSACVTGIDENTSAMRDPLDMLTRVSELTGCAFLVLHHTRKPPENPSVKVDKEMSLRGSSGIHAACSTIWVLDHGSKGVLQLTHVKSRASKVRDSLNMNLTDVDGGGVYIELAQVPKVGGALDKDGQDPRETERQAREAQKETVRVQLITKYLTAHPDGAPVTAIIKGVGQRKDLVRDTIATMRFEGAIEENPGVKGARLIRLVKFGPDKAPPEPDHDDSDDQGDE